MEYKQARSVIAKLSHQIQWLALAIVMLLIANAVLGLLLWHQSGNEKLVLIPAGLTQKAMLSRTNVSPAYLEAMSLMILNDRLNVTPQTVVGNNQNLLAVVDARFYAAFKQQLSKDAKAIQSGSISSVFYVTSLASDPKELVVSVTGQLKRWVGDRLIGVALKAYRLSFSKRGHPLLLKSFQEIENPNKR